VKTEMKHLGPACHGQAEVGDSRKEDFILSASDV